MVALIEGTRAPEIKLQGLDGETHSLKEIIKGSQQAVVAFFKVSCPVCQFTFPYLERLHRAHPELPLIGVSQDDADATRAFVVMSGCSFPILLDEMLQSTVDYDLETVPTTFVVGQDMSIKQTIVGFDKAGLESIHEAVGGTAPFFTADDEVPGYRPG